MLKTMLKKQFLELNSFYFLDKKTGKRRSTAGIVGFAALFLLIFLSIAAMFFGYAAMLGSALTGSLEWIYYAMMGLAAIMFGVFGSVFNTYAGLYQAKDNELLLSMPIPPSVILFTRMTGVYAMSLLYTSLVWVPTALIGILTKEPTAAGVIYMVLLDFIIALLVTVLTCVLGYLVALIANRLRNKTFMVVILPFLFLGVYWFVCFRINSLLETLMVNGEKFGAAIMRWIYPIYQMGRAAAGDTFGMLFFTAMTALLFTLCCFVMSKSFIRIVTTSRGMKKAVYRERALKVSGVKSALFGRELKRFLSSPAYLMNAGLGIVLEPVLAVLIVVKADTIKDYMVLIAAELPFVRDLLPVLVLSAICSLVSMNCISAPSVSLEGKNLWIVRSMPVETWEILHAKEMLHVVLNLVPAYIVAGAAAFVLQVDVLSVIYILVVVFLFDLFAADMGLVMNLKNPNLEWTNEAVPIKQSLSVMIVLFGGWIVSIGIIACYYALHEKISAHQFLAGCCVVFGVVCAGIGRWLRTRGAGIFERL